MMFLVSIHAPAQGATLSLPNERATLSCFNPRPRAGGDNESGHSETVSVVSIHASAQGATVFFYLLLFNEFSLSSARTICLFVLTDILFSKNILISPVISSCFILREHPWFSMSSTGSRAVR